MAISDDDLDIAATYIRELLEVLTTLEPIPHSRRSPVSRLHGPGGWVHEFCLEEGDRIVLGGPERPYMARRSDTCVRCGEIIDRGDEAAKIDREALPDTQETSDQIEQKRRERELVAEIEAGLA